MSSTIGSTVKISALLATIALTLTVLAGCGNDSEPKAATNSDAYCDSLAATAKEHFSGSDDVFVDPAEAYKALHLIAGQAPKAVSAEWKAVDESLQAMLATLDKLGITFDDLDAIFEGKSPEGSDVDPAEAMAALEPVFSAASAPELIEAQNKIQQHAKSECSVDLELGVAMDED